MKATRRFVFTLVLGVASGTARADLTTVDGWVLTNPIVTNTTTATEIGLALPFCNHGEAACTFENANVRSTATGADFKPFLLPDTIAQFLASSAIPLENLVDKSPNSRPPNNPVAPSLWEVRRDSDDSHRSPHERSHRSRHERSVPEPASTVILLGASWGALVLGGKLFVR